MRQNEIITFDTEWGRYLCTRAERYRTAILQGAGEAQARHLAYSPPTYSTRATSATFSADFLAEQFDLNGKSIRTANYLHPVMQRHRVRAPRASRAAQHV